MLTQRFIVINEKTSSPSPRKTPWISIGVVLLILALLGFAFLALPKGFKATHEQIGTGKPAVVFVYDPNLAVSITQPEQMNIAREQLGDQVFFLVAQISTPEGDRLIARHNAEQAELLLFDASGQLIKRRFALVGAHDLMQWATTE